MSSVVFNALPEGWGWVRLKWVLSTLESGRRELSVTDSYEGEVLSIGGEHIGWQGEWLLEKPRYISHEFFAEMSKGKIRQYDVFLVKDGATIGKVAIADLLPAPEAAVNEHVFLLRISPENSSKFYFYYLQSSIAQDQIHLEIRGSAQPGLNSEFRNIVLAPQPPKIEQCLIAEFLDVETAKIDKLVSKKRELLEKLKEKRSALISRTVTRGLPPEAARAAGLNPNPKLNPSGIEWLGEIPEHWELVRIGRKITLQRGVDITKDQQNEGSIPVVSSGGISSFHDKALACGPGVVVGRKGTAGAVYYIASDFWPHDTTLWVREFRKNFPKYVYYKLRSMDLESFDTGSSNPTVNRNLVHPVLVSWPPGPEQRIIADYLDRETNKIDRMVTKVEDAIERLQEYRTALITAAVTGKIDVRGYGDSVEAT